MAEHRIGDADKIPVIHSFIIRIWLEEMETETKRPDWHGHITYVSDGERRYIKRLSEISKFIRTRLPILGED